MTLATIFVLVAVVLFGLAAFGVPSSKVSLGWLGLMFWALAHLFGNVSIS